MDSLACGHLVLATVLQAENNIPGANQALTEASQVMCQHPLDTLWAVQVGEGEQEAFRGDWPWTEAMQACPAP